MSLPMWAFSNLKWLPNLFDLINFQFRVWIRAQPIKRHWKRHTHCWSTTTLYHQLFSHYSVKFERWVAAGFQLSSYGYFIFNNRFRAVIWSLMILTDECDLSQISTKQHCWCTKYETERCSTNPCAKPVLLPRNCCLFPNQVFAANDCQVESHSWAESTRRLWVTFWLRAGSNLVICRHKTPFLVITTLLETSALYRS